MTSALTRGEWVRLKRRHCGCRLGRVLRQDQRLIYVQTDAYMELACTRDDITRSASQAGPAHDYFPMREQLPYGRYNCTDGSYVLFNRDYEPIHRVRADGSYSICDPTERIAHKSKEWFYSDENPPWMNRLVLNSCVQRLPQG